MGLGDKLDGMKDKAMDMIGDNKEKIAEGVDKAADMIDEKTGHKYSGHIDKGVDMAKGALNRLADDK